MNSFAAVAIINSALAISCAAVILGLYHMGAGLHCFWGLAILLPFMVADRKSKP